jgi:hypothetical protein
VSRRHSRRFVKPSDLIVPVGVVGLLGSASAALLEPHVVAATDQRHAEQEPGVGPRRREPERGRRGCRAPANRPLLAGGKARVQVTHHYGRTPATCSIAFWTSVESSVMALAWSGRRRLPFDEFVSVLCPRRDSSKWRISRGAAPPCLFQAIIGRCGGGPASLTGAIRPLVTYRKSSYAAYATTPPRHGRQGGPP